jgi:hypothetical protein
MRQPLKIDDGIYIETHYGSYPNPDVHSPRLGACAYGFRLLGHQYSVKRKGAINKCVKCTP